MSTNMLDYLFNQYKKHSDDIALKELMAELCRQVKELKESDTKTK